jgi:decaprenylphospho-beta-D-ribofuranose 2-oxidase
VGWVDLLATGGRLGRGVVTAGDHAPLAALDSPDHADARAFAPSVRLGTPGWVPPGLLNRATVRAFNELWFRKAPRVRRGELQSIGAFFHPLDGLRDWNRLYGPAGFLQHQFVVPFGAESTLRTIVERFAASGAPSFLAVLKRFGPGDAAPLSFPMPGWTLALDLPAGTPGLAGLLDGIDRLVVDAGGRLYLAKDARLDPAMLRAMYPRLDEWRTTRDRLDPERRMMSDLARRLDLLGPTGMPS